MPVDITGGESMMFRRQRFWAGFFSLALLASCATHAPTVNSSAVASPCSAAQAQDSPRTIAPTDLQVGPGHSTPVISAAQKFIIPVPAWRAAGEPLVYPASHEQEGQPILDYQGNPVGDRGIIFFNGKDQSWQAAAGDGAAVIIINEVTAAQANQLYSHIQTATPNPNDLTLEQLKQVLDFAQNDLGLVDMYNSDRAYIQENMTPAIATDVPTFEGAEIEAYGFKKRDARDINQAIYIPGAFVFEGPAATPQEFAAGGVIVEKDGEMRGVQPDIFERTYLLSDGRAITAVATALAAQCE